MENGGAVHIEKLHGKKSVPVNFFFIGFDDLVPIYR
jgi:hypothetical protein